MKSKEAIDPAKVALFSVDGEVRDSNCRDKSGINTWKPLTQKIARFIGACIFSLVTAGNRRMLITQWLSALGPVIPVKLRSPRQLQHVFEEKTQGVHFLAKLPGRELWALPQPSQPELNVFWRLGFEFYSFMRVDESLYMFSISGTGPFRNTKLLGHVDIALPKQLDLRINAVIGRIKRHSDSLLYKFHVKNIYRTLGRFVQYSRETHDQLLGVLRP